MLSGDMLRDSCQRFEFPAIVIVHPGLQDDDFVDLAVPLADEP